MRTYKYRPTKPESTTTTMDQYAAEMMPLNLNDVCRVTSTGPTMPANKCTSSQVFAVPTRVALLMRLRAMYANGTMMNAVPTTPSV